MGSADSIVHDPSGLQKSVWDFLGFDASCQSWREVSAVVLQGMKHWLIKRHPDTKQHP